MNNNLHQRLNADDFKKCRCIIWIISQPYIKYEFSINHKGIIKTSKRAAETFALFITKFATDNYFIKRLKQI